MRGMMVAMRMMLLGGALAVTAPAWSQEQTGNMQGIVKDSSGGVLPGVTVEAHSQARPAGITAVTDDRGAYRFQALPPGDYEVTASLEGFNPAKRQVPVRLGQTLQVDLVLTIGTLEESVTVTSDAPMVDVHTNAATTELRREVIEALPNARDFTSVITVAVGANAETMAGGISIDGATGAENRFVIDGVDTTETQTGQSGKLYLTDFLDEVQVKSSGYNAEFGGATGGVVSAITKSGTNTWRGTAGSYFQDRDLNGAQRPTLRLGLTDPNIAEVVTYPIDPYRDLEPTVSLGGPLLKDRLFIYNGYAAQLQRTQRTVTFLAGLERHFVTLTLAAGGSNIAAYWSAAGASVM